MTALAFEDGGASIDDEERSLLTPAPQEALDHEMGLLDRVAAGEASFFCSIWSTQRCLIAPCSLSRNPCFEHARARMAAKGWPVFLRSTGGDVTPQAPGIINISIIFTIAPGRPKPIQDAYRMLCAPILSRLETLGIPAYSAAAPGSFCDGAYNIVVAGKKLAGTAQRWRQLKRSNGPSRSHAVLAHAFLLCQVDLAEVTGAVNEFYRSCKIEHRVRRDSHITLSDLCEIGTPTMCRDATPRLIAKWLGDAFHARFGAGQIRHGRLWRDQGRRAEAHNLLAPVYDGFTEGFATADLKAAKALLDELA